MPVRRTVRTVPLDDASPVGVLTAHVDLPSTRCPACGMDQVPGRSQQDLATALRHALVPGQT